MRDSISASKSTSWFYCLDSSEYTASAMLSSVYYLSIESYVSNSISSSIYFVSKSSLYSDSLLVSSILFMIFSELTSDYYSIAISDITSTTGSVESSWFACEIAKRRNAKNKADTLAFIVLKFNKSLILEF